MVNGEVVRGCAARTSVSCLLLGRKASKFGGVLSPV